MPGRRLISEAEAAARGMPGQPHARRRAVLRETIDAFEAADPPDRFHRLAERNLASWRAHRTAAPVGLEVGVHPDDWGEVAGRLTMAHGACFAVLNMANAWFPGGGYVEGAAAQEENMFRRTDCHFRLSAEEFDPARDEYHPAMTRLISGVDGVVYLDVERPRVCIRGPEDRSRPDLGYRWLEDHEVFPFHELRAAARDYRDGAGFDAEDATRRIRAQFDTLSRHGIRHAVLGAFGCGVFRNPADRVAAIYRREIESRRAAFDVIAFAVFHPGYGPDNFTPFARAFAGMR